MGGIRFDPFPELPGVVGEAGEVRSIPKYDCLFADGGGGGGERVSSGLGGTICDAGIGGGIPLIANGVSAFGVVAVDPVA